MKHPLRNLVLSVVALPIFVLLIFVAEGPLRFALYAAGLFAAATFIESVRALSGAQVPASKPCHRSEPVDLRSITFDAEQKR